uniref:oligosaccharide flippase family protein n=1 Tax=Polaribacter sp. TaxID=1920175 RepID=UPI0040484968
MNYKLFNFFPRKLNKDNSTIVKNLSYLTLMRFFNIGFKFLIVAYLIRVLGEKTYGLLTWLDSIIQYFLMFINFGFNIYAAKYIVEFRKDHDKINEVVSSIITIKALLFIISVFLVVGISMLDDFSNYAVLFNLLILIGIGEVLFPIWFFQGVENLKPATIIVFFSRLLMILGTLAFVQAEHDAIYYVAMLVISSTLMGVYGIFHMHKFYKIKLIRVSASKLYYFIKESFPFFAGRFLSLVFNFGTIFLIGKFCNFEMVAGFDLALKVIMVGVIPFEMLQQAVFPTLVRTKNKSFLIKLTKGAFFLGLIVGLLVYLFANEIIFVFGGAQMLSYALVLQFLAIMTPFVALTYILGTCSLVAFGHFKEYNLSLISTSIIYLVVIIVLYSFDLINFWNLIYLRIFADILMCLIRFYYSFRKKVFVY